MEVEVNRSVDLDNNGTPPTDSKRATPERDLPWPGFIGSYAPPAPYRAFRLIEGGKIHEPLDQSHRPTISASGESPLRLVEGNGTSP